MSDISKRDANRVTSLLAVSNIDGLSPVTLYADPSTHALEVSASITNVLVTETFDYIGATYPDTSTEVYTFKTGGSGGTTVATITCVYSDAVTKAILTSVTKS